MIKVGILGSTGYVGQQLVWLLHHHSNTQIEFLSSHNHAGIPYNEIYNNYYDFIQSDCISMQQAEDKLSEIDLLFSALPHGKSFDIVNKAISKEIKVIDISADFRLKSVKCYEDWYNVKHKCTNLIDKAVYGLCELHRNEIYNSNLVANPGCYPTASILAMAPLLKHNIIDPSSIIIDAKSGVTGSGRSANISGLYCECNESFKAYGVGGTHRHTPEIEQELSNISNTDIKLSFTPHLVPMDRGILATCYANLNKDISEEEIFKLYKDAYKDDYFIKITESLPETRWVKGTNFCQISFRIDKRTQRIIVVSAIDNLMKGAASQAVQNMNLLFGLDEKEGLDTLSLFP